MKKKKQIKYKEHNNPQLLTWNQNMIHRKMHKMKINKNILLIQIKNLQLLIAQLNIPFQVLGILGLSLVKKKYYIKKNQKRIGDNIHANVHPMFV